MPRLTVDAQELIGALQDHADEAEHFLDRQTGEIVFRVYEGISEPDEEFESRLEADPERFLYVEPMASYIGWKIMADFCDRYAAGEARTELERALSQSHPFRRFKTALLGHPDLRDNWFTFEHRAMLDIAHRWLEQNGIEADLRPNKL